MSYKETYKKVVITNFLQYYDTAKALHHLEMMKMFFNDDTPKYQQQATDELIEEYKDKRVDEMLLEDN